MYTSQRATIFGVPKRIVKIVQFVMLFGMLHSTFVVPAQIVITNYYHSPRYLITKYANFYEDIQINENENRAVKNKSSIVINESVVNSQKTPSSFSGGEFHIDGAGIIISDSLLIDKKNISILELAKKDIVALNYGLINVTKNGSAFRFLGNGAKLKNPFKIWLEYDPKLLPEGYSEEDIATFYFNKKTKSWVSVPKDSVDFLHKRIFSLAEDFTDYINGIIVVPETPETSAFLPTMMGDIKASDPSSGMTLIAPPEVSQKGSGVVSYPLKVPLGRNGMQPDLSVSYDSDRGNGFLGLGWDIAISSIGIDTRWGVPVLDALKETEIYTLNGEQLMYPKIKNSEGAMVDWMPNRHYDATSDQQVYSTVERARISDAVFTFRKQGDFRKIERLGIDPSNYYWRVTDTKGTISWYGGKSGVVENSVLKNEEGKIVHWGLYMVEDVFGNTMRYQYANGTIENPTGVNSNLSDGNYFYIENIYYNGYDDLDYGYKIEFHPKIDFSSGIREDVSFDSRLGVKWVNSKLLSRIDVKNGEDIIRKYKLNYGLSKFGKYLLESIAEHNAKEEEFYNHKFDYYDDLQDGQTDVYFSEGVLIDTCFDDGGGDNGGGETGQCFCYYIDPNLDLFKGHIELVYNSGASSVFFYSYEALFSYLSANFSAIITSQEYLSTVKVCTSKFFSDPFIIYIHLSTENSYTIEPMPCRDVFGYKNTRFFEDFSSVFTPFFPDRESECVSMFNSEFLVGGSSIPSFTSSFSVLGSSSSKSESFGGYFGFPGIGCNWLSKSITLGFGYGISRNRDKSAVSMIDINGDGLLDIVLQEGNTISYRPHSIERSYDENGSEIITHSFGEKRFISGIDTFYSSVGKSEQFNFSFNSKYFSLGWEKTHSKSTTEIYFTDANGDGLVDIVKNGVVYFNRLDAQGNPYFSPDSKETENMVIVAEPFSVDEPQEMADFEFPVYDVVKVWEAPADGIISIENQIQLIDPSQEATITVEYSQISRYDAPVIYCPGVMNPSGNKGVYTYLADFGTSTGYIGICYDSYIVPDKFDIKWNGNLATTNYVGSSNFDSQLLNLGVPENQINTSNPSNGKGVLYIQKSSAYPTTAEITVTAPLNGTAWTFTTFCPVDNITNNFSSKFSLNQDNETKKHYQLNFSKTDINVSLSDNLSVFIDDEFIGNYVLNTDLEKFTLDFQQKYPVSEVEIINDEITISIYKTDKNIEKLYLKTLGGEIATALFFKQEHSKGISNSIFQKRNSKSTSNQGGCFDFQETCLLYGTHLSSDNSVVHHTITNFGLCDPTNPREPLRVSRGDRIYFRVHSSENWNTKVNWDPKISYTDSQYTTIYDQNGNNLYQSSYSDGFILSQKIPFTLPKKNGTASVTWNGFMVNDPSDDVTFKIIEQKIDLDSGDIIDNSQTILYSKVCPAGQNTLVVPTSLNTINISETGDVVEWFFVVESKSNVKWKDYQWSPEVTTTIFEDVIGADGNTSEGTLTTEENHYPVVDYSIYKDFVCGPSYKMFGLNANPISIEPNYQGIFSSDDTGKIHFVVKNNGTLVGSRSLQLTNGNLGSFEGEPMYNVPISLENILGSQIEIGYYVEWDQSDFSGENLSNKLLSVITKITYSNSNDQYVSVNQGITIYHKSDKFGPMYRGWGQFFYNPDKVSGAVSTPYGNLIKQEALFPQYNYAAIENLVQIGENINGEITENDTDTSFLEQLASLENQYDAFVGQGDAFLPATAKRTSLSADKWIGLHQENYATAYSYQVASFTTALSSDYDGQPYNFQGILATGAYGINKIFYSKGQNIASNSLSKSIQGSGKIVTDYTDLNGDRYPEVVTTEQIQFTTRTGGLKPVVSRTGQESLITIHKNSSFGFGVSGGFGGNNTEQGSKNSFVNKISKIVNSQKSNTSIGLSGNFSNGKSLTDSFWTDINGDGLPDLISKENSIIKIYLNRGGKLENSGFVWTNLGTIFESGANNIGGGVGFSLWNSSIQGGISLSSSWNNTKTTFVDLNGDGLVDFVDTQNDLTVRLNQGNRFIKEAQWSNFDLNKESVSVGSSKNLAFTVSPNIGIPFTKICFKLFALTINGTASTSTSKTEKMITDFDGDGYPDLIEKISNTQIRVYHSRIRRTDKLKSVTNPLGGKFTLDYKVHKISYDNPNPKWVISSVTIADGYDLANDGSDVYRKEFVYENPRYDRREREFYGFETIKTLDYTLDEQGNPQEVYRTLLTQYHNQSYFLNGRVKQTALYKGAIEDNKLYHLSQDKYQIRALTDDNNHIDLTDSGLLPDNFDVGGTEGRRSAVVLLMQTKNYTYELGDSPLVNVSSMKYDEKGRIIEYDYKGNPADPSDDYKTKISYHNSSSLTDKNILQTPLEVTVWEGGQLKRKRQTDTIDPNTGAIGIVKHFYTTNDYAKTDIEYDQFGNIVQIEYPENHNGQKMAYQYEYDSTYHKHITKITDAFGYTSETKYDFDFDLPTEVTDITGNKTQYQYDSFGRLSQVRGPKEIQANKPYTLAFDYFPKYSDLPGGIISLDDFVPVARTKHYDEQHPNNTIDTYTFMDGLARVVQVKKDFSQNINSDYQELMSVSGAVTYDEFSRAIKQYHPLSEPKNENINFKYNSTPTNYFTQTHYDAQDRVVKHLDEAGNPSFTEYSITENLHKTRYVTQQNDNVDIISESFKDANERIIKTNTIGQEGDIITKFKYNAIGELLSYTDDSELTTSYKYDLLGRKIAMQHPDRGLTRYHYDKASNLIQLHTANLIAANKHIKYDYNYNRLEQIIFPEFADGTQNISDVVYKYGDVGSGNDTGRLIYQRDASGEQRFSYGNMGELVYNWRMVVTPSPTLPIRIFETHFDYDSWNRLRSMIYPDGEKVGYRYDLGGNLYHIEGDMTYVERIDYNHYGERIFIKYGNKTQTDYTYTPDLRRLERVQTISDSSGVLLDTTYDYDKIGNVTAVENSQGFNPVNGMGGSYAHRYVYDQLNRLDRSEGYFTGNTQQAEINNDFQSSYALRMAYDNTHRIAAKRQEHKKNNESFLPNTYANSYQYFENTHRIKEIVNANTQTSEHFRYDFNGNVIARSNQYNSVEKRYFWDEADRLRVLYQGEKRLHHYIYDASGQRILKASSTMEQVYQNGQLINSNVQMGNYTSYPSAFLVVNPDGIYSKHYYAGSERIAARVGDKKADDIFRYKNKPSSRLSEKTDFDPEGLKTLQQADLQRYLNKTNFKTNLKFKKYEEKTENNNVPFGDLAQKLIYYYHLDYLGTANFLTDGEGLIYEFFLNLPFGETMAEQHAQTADYTNRWKFTGHELDRETGLYYAGARYYDPKVSVFLSTDVLMEKYPSWTPYNYTLNNPINLVDPTGMEADDPPLGMPRKHGTPYSDSTGSWKYDEPSNTWLGQNGSPDIENVKILDEVVVEAVTSDAIVNVFTETDGVGHTYIQVGNHVFSNGRYNGSDSPSMGRYGMTGDNVLIKYSGQEAMDFIENRRFKFPTTTQKVDNINASKVFFNLNQRYHSGNINTSGQGVIDGRYRLLSRNCTTCTVEALNSGGTNFSAIDPKALPIQINLHNSGVNPRTFFRDRERYVQRHMQTYGLGGLKY